ncbi:MAG: MATE family efflux transporter [Actinobacteria bacterium]|nr:MATE family efflux transporter [Actinomycetota bacterium]
MYNFVDTIFVGNGVGSLAIAALTIVMPMQIFMLAIGLMIGVGASSIISRALGSGDHRLAAKAGGNAFIINAMISLILMAASFIFIDDILKFFGASSDVLPYARDYLSIILFGFVFFSFSLSANHIIRAEGRPRAAVYPMIAGAVLNIILDPVFIFVLGMGVKGAALATLISQAASTAFIILYFFKGKSILHPNTGMFRLNPAIIKDILLIGFPSFLMAIVDSVIFLVYNRALLYYGNDLYIAISGITIRILDIIVMPMIGIAYGFSTIASFNYGAKLYERVKRVFGEAILWTALIALAGFMAAMFLPGQLLSIFTDDTNLVRMGIMPMRIIVTSFPVIGFLITGGSLFQAIGKPIPALFIDLSRQVIFLIPAIFILPFFFGLNGVFASWPVSDFLSFIVTGAFVAYEFRNLERLQVPGKKQA